MREYTTEIKNATEIVLGNIYNIIILTFAYIYYIAMLIDCHTLFHHCPVRYVDWAMASPKEEG